jgi:O-antigen ligase
MFIFTVAFVGGDAVVSRIEQIPEEVEARGPQAMNRRMIWQATGRMIKEQPLVGIGFGAYETAFPAFDLSGGKWVPKQAHNDYLEVLANGGVVAFALFAIFAIIVLRRGIKNFGSADLLARSSCFGALLGMFGVIVHSVADFGLHVMINALIFSALVVIATARITHAKSHG